MSNIIEKMQQDHHAESKELIEFAKNLQKSYQKDLGVLQDMVAKLQEERNRLQRELDELKRTR